MSTGQTHHLKKRLFVLRPGQSCPLTSTDPAGFSAVLVYSFLVYRLKMKKGAQNLAVVTNKQIQRGTALCRARTIPKAITLLEGHGLLGQVNNRVFAHQGQSGTWFVQMKSWSNKPWYARLAYFPIWIPANGVEKLTPRQNALYWLIVSKPRQTQNYYAKLLGIDEKTVARAVKTLRAKKLMSWSQLEPLELQDEHLALWQDKAQKTPKKNDFQLSKSDLFSKITEATSFNWFEADESRKLSGYECFCERLDGYGNQMRAAGYSTLEVTTYWEPTATKLMLDSSAMLTLELFVRDFGRIFEHVEAESQRNRATGAFHGNNSLGLLTIVTRQATEQLKIAWENHRTYGGLCLWSWSPDV